MVEPTENPNPSMMIDPPGWLRSLMRHQIDRIIDPVIRKKRRMRAEAQRRRKGRPHIVEYFHQLDDPYSYLAAQTLQKLAARYDIVIEPHLIAATGGKDQPELEKLSTWVRRDAELIAPHYNLDFPQSAPLSPDVKLQERAARYLTGLSGEVLLGVLSDVSAALWNSDGGGLPGPIVSHKAAKKVLEAGSTRLKKMKHYSGAMLYYAGEWYWGVDRLFHLEQRLRDLGAYRGDTNTYIVPRPKIDVAGVDARSLTLDFYPSLNSPYTSIIYDKVIELKNLCCIQFRHKPVLPMIMRGVPATRAKGNYIMFDTKREAEYLGVPFGPVITPIGEPVRRAYSLLPWAMEVGKDEALMSALLRCAFSDGIALHTRKGLRMAVEAAGLDWNDAREIVGIGAWKPMVERFQEEMVEGMELWGVPSFRLSSPDGEPDLTVWGQDRLWLVAEEIRRPKGTNLLPFLGWRAIGASSPIILICNA